MLTVLTHMPHGLENHLWQSTAFAAIAWLLALALRRNQARTRYWIWFAASMKFLLPFSFLFAIGSYLRPVRVAIVAAPIAETVQQIAQPFSDITVSGPYAPAATLQIESVLTIALFAVWAFGFLAICFSWERRWRRVRRACATATPGSVCLGGTGTLGCAHSDSKVTVKFSSSLLEPGVFGIFRPVLMLPEGIVDRLTPTQMNAILAHEMSHIRRRDNLTAALHMFVEAAFWFHPIVWWIGARLVEERENACDEEVMRLVGEPQIYAESILEVCKFYTEAPVACVSGVSGADLKKRIVRIMSWRFAEKLTTGGKLLISLAAISVIAVPLAFGAIAAPRKAVFKRISMLDLRQGGPAYGGDSVHASEPDDAGKPLPSFEVASIKLDKSGVPRHGFGFLDPDRFRVSNMNGRGIIEFAYSVKDFQVWAGPTWVDSNEYDIEAKLDDSAARMTSDERYKEVRLMLRSLLADRFKLQLRHDMKDEPEYALVVAKGGPRLKPTTWAEPDPNAPKPTTPPQKGPALFFRPGQLTAVDQPLSGLCDLLELIPDTEGHRVVDHTGVTGKYDFTVHFTSEALNQKMAQNGKMQPEPDDLGPSIFTALEEHLGLKLEMTKGPVDIYTIEHIEEPSDN